MVILSNNKDAQALLSRSSAHERTDPFHSPVASRGRINSTASDSLSVSSMGSASIMSRSAVSTRSGSRRAAAASTLLEALKDVCTDPLTGEVTLKPLRFVPTEFSKPVMQRSKLTYYETLAAAKKA